MKLIRLIGVLTAVVVAGIAASGYWSDPHEPEAVITLEERGADSLPTEERGSAPNFRLPDLSGETVQLSGYQGEVVFLNFWASWCGPCRIEAPALQRLYERMEGKEFEIIAVSMDVRKEDIERFVKQYGLRFSILWDQDQDVARIYAVKGIPVSLLIDKRGRVVSRIIGARNWDSDMWIEHIENLLEE